MKNSMLKRQVIFLVNVILLFSFASLKEGNSQKKSGMPEKLKKITMDRSGGTQSMSQITYEIARKQGFYKAEGMELEIVNIRGALISAAIISGGLDYTGSAARTVHLAAAGGAVKLVFVASTQRATFLVTRPDIKRIQDLRGKSVGVGSIGGSEQIAIKEAFAKLGQETIEKDIHFMGIGPQMKAPALTSGSLDAAFCQTAEKYQLKKKGFNVLIKISDVVGALSQGLGVSDKKLRENPSQTKRMIRATLRGLLFTREKKGEVINFMTKDWGMEKDLSTEVYDDDIRYFTKNGIAPDDEFWEEVDKAKTGTCGRKENLVPGLSILIGIIYRLRKISGHKGFNQIS